MRLFASVQFSDRRRIERVLRNLNPSVQSFRCVIGQNRNFALRDDVAVIDSFIDTVDGATGYLLAGGECLLPSFESGVFWQERGMNIEDSTWECFEHRRFQDAHKASQNHQLNTGVAQHSHQLHLRFWLESGPKFSRRQISVATENSRAISRIGASRTS